MNNKTIELHTIATFQGKEYELENLLNGLLNKLEEKDKEIERLRKREKKWEKWTTEKEILSTKMSEYLCKWKNIKREYKNQVESNRLKKQEIERLKAREQECIDKYLVESKYRSEIEGKYVVDEYIINELEKDMNVKIEEDRLNIISNSHWLYVLDKLKALKEGKE